MGDNIIDSSAKRKRFCLTEVDPIFAARLDHLAINSNIPPRPTMSGDNSAPAESQTNMDTENENIVITTPLPLSNKYGLLDIADPEGFYLKPTRTQRAQQHPHVAKVSVATKSTSTRTSKPPPIILAKKIAHIQPFHAECKKVTTEQVLFQTIRNQTWIYTSTIDDFRSLKNHIFTTMGESGYTYTPAEERHQKIVLKASPGYLSEDEISQELSNLQLKPTTILNMKSKYGDLTGSFLLQYPASTNMASLRGVRSIGPCLVRWQEYSKRATRTQCHRCQQFGHGSSNCHLPPRCVKCTGFHITTSCQRTVRDEQVKCCNCGGNHAANYRDCQTYLDYEKKVSTNTQRQPRYTQETASPQFTTREFPSLPAPRQTFKPVTSSQTYAQHLTTPTQQTKPPQQTNQANPGDIKTLFQELKELNETFNIAQMINMVREIKHRLTGVTDTFTKLQILQEIAAKYDD